MVIRQDDIRPEFRQRRDEAVPGVYTPVLKNHANLAQHLLRQLGVSRFILQRQNLQFFRHLDHSVGRLFSSSQ